MRFLIMLALVIMSSATWAQTGGITSGPMVGYSTAREVKLWVQTSGASEVLFEYWPKGSRDQAKRTEVVLSEEQHAFAVSSILTMLEPNTHYAYAVIVNGKNAELPYELEFVTQPVRLGKDRPTFTFTTGSCSYVNDAKYDKPGKPYGKGYGIFTEMHKLKPSFMLWLGDNLYYQEADFTSKSGMLYRNTHTRSLKELQPFLASVHHYAIWDDHDFGPNNSDRSFPLKSEAEEVFKRFWANPPYVFDEGITSHFSWADCDFFLMDNRFWRAPNLLTDLEDHPVFGEEQIEWLLDALSNSKAAFKFVAMGGQLLNPLEEYENLVNCAPEERDKILRAIDLLGIEGVVFLTGDRHHSELSAKTLARGTVVFDLTVSPLTSKAYGTNAHKNPLQVEGTLVRERNFAHLKVSGNADARLLSISVHGTDGKLIWEKSLDSKGLVQE